MISLTFAQFFRGEFEDEGYDLYMVKDADQVMYIGISRVSVWHRWFGQVMSHMGMAGEDRLYGISPIGQAIARRLPDLWNWTVELWTKQACCNALTEEFNSRNADEIPISPLEALLIRKFEPRYNSTHHTSAPEDPLISRALDQAHRDVFEKNDDTGDSSRGMP